MRRVKFIESLNVSEKMVGGMDDIRYHQRGEIEPIRYSEEGEFLISDEPITEAVCSVNQFSKMEGGERIDTYIAWSKEVQDLIGTPFDLMKGSIDNLQSIVRARDVEVCSKNERISSILNSTIIERFKFLFTGSI